MAYVGAPGIAQTVGNAFVNKYYHLLTHSPQLVHGFYKEESRLSRLDHRGEMIIITGLDAIKENLLSFNYSQYTAEITMADVQESLDGGVIVLVTGYLTGKDDVKKTFAQGFFLATQDNGYYILNDMFRLVNDQPSSRDWTVKQQEKEVPEEEKLDEAETVDPSAGISWSVKEEVQAGKEIDEICNSLQTVNLNPSSSTTLEESQPSGPIDTPTRIFLEGFRKRTKIRYSRVEQQENKVPEEEKLDEAETIDPSAGISWSVKEEVQAGKEIDEICNSLQTVNLNPSSSTTLEESQPSEPIDTPTRLFLEGFKKRTKIRYARVNNRGWYGNREIKRWSVFFASQSCTCTEFVQENGCRSC